jgi:dynein heavy chain
VHRCRVWQDEIFLENINNILSSGEVPNLFDDADLGTIFDKMTPMVQQQGLPTNKTNLFAQFIKMIRKYLHIVMCMSPLGEEYRSRIRQFPSLINCTTIDWFSPWPAEALSAVANQLMAKEAETLEDKVFQGIVQMCTTLHNSVRDQSVKFLDEMRRHTYVTSTSYLELITVIQAVLKIQEAKIQEKKSRLEVGLDKLKSTKEIVSTLQAELAANQPVLERTTIQVKEQQVQIAADKEDALIVKAEAETASAAANKKSAECQQIKSSAEAGLAEALPALDAAVKCLAKLDKGQIVEVKALKKPPAGVRLTLKAVCIMFQIKPERITDPDNAQKKIEDYWGPSQKMLNDLGPDKFKKELMEFDKDNIPESVIKLIDPVCGQDDFTPDAICKVSVACEAMCMWCHAMRKYYYVSKEVEPKRRQLAAAEEELGIATASKNAAEAKLAAVTEKVARLEAELQAAVEKMASLEEQVERATVQLSNADKLISGLGGEAKSWEDTVVRLTEQLKNNVGDVLVCAGTISYLGPFTATYRARCVDEWIVALGKQGIPCTKDCSLAKILADPVLVRQWNIDGLPADSFSVENGIIMSVTKRWPLMIDPQGQANFFIKRSQAKAQLKSIKASDSTKKIQQTLEMGIRLGQPVLLENVLEALDPFLDPVLANQTYKDATGSLVIKLGENVIPYHADFKFSLTTVLPNPHYAPEVSVKVAMLNFAITQDGLEDQVSGL